MTAPRPSPLVGYNTGVRYRGAEYHVQTEDSGIDHPHVITHLFAHGGHIVATRKTSYAEHVGTDAYPEAVRQLIRAQHKAMLVALRDGEYDLLLDRLLPGDHAASAPCVQPAAPPPIASPRAEPAPASAPPKRARTAGDLPPPRLEAESSRDSLDEIIVGDLVRLLDDRRR